LPFDQFFAIEGLLTDLQGTVNKRAIALTGKVSISPIAKSQQLALYALKISLL